MRQFKTFGEQIESISFGRIQAFGTSRGTLPGSHLHVPSVFPIANQSSTNLQDDQSWFGLALGEWRELNLTAGFATFYSEVYPISLSLPQLLFHRDEIISLLVNHLSQDQKGLAAAPLSALAATLAKDLGEELAPAFPQLLDSLLTALERVAEVEVMEVVLGSLFFFVKSLAPYIHPPVIVGELLRSFQSKSSLCAQVQDFLAEFSCFLLQSSTDPEIIAKVLGALSGERLRGLAACILVGFIQRKRLFLPEHLLHVIEATSQRADAVELLGMVFMTMADRNGSSSCWSAVALTIPKVSTASLPVFLQAFLKTAVFEHGRLLGEHQTLLSLLCELAPTPSVQDAVLAVLQKSTLDAVLSQRQPLRRTMGDLRGVCLIVRMQRELIDPLFGFTHVAQQIFDGFPSTQNDTKARMLLFLLADLNATQASQVCARIHTKQLIDQLPATVNAENFILARLTLRLLSKIPAVIDLPWMASMCADQPAQILFEQWLILLSEGSRFIRDSATLSHILIPHISNIHVLRLLTFFPIQTCDPAALVPLLVSSDHERRCATLHLLCRGAFTKTGIFENCLQLELVPWTFNSDRQKGLHLQRLSILLRNTPSSAVDPLEVETAITYLFGLLLTGFQSLMRELYTTLSTVFDVHPLLGKKILCDLLRRLSCYEPAPHSFLAHEKEQLQLNGENAYFFSAKDEIDSIMSGSAPLGPDATLPQDVLFFTPTCLAPLLHFLAAKPAVADLTHATMVPLLMDVFEGPTTASAWFAKSLKSGLGDLLPAVGGMRSAKSSAANELFLKRWLLRLLASGDGETQTRALDATISIGIYQGLALYQDRLRRLLDEKEMSSELVLLASEQDNLCQAEAWKTFLSLLVPILLGRLTSRRGTSSGRNSMLTRRKFIINYVCTWDSDSVHAFLVQMAEPLQMSLEESKRIGFLSLLHTLLAKIGKSLSPASIDLLFALLDGLFRAEYSKVNDKQIRALLLKCAGGLYAVLPNEGDFSGWCAKIWATIQPRVSRLEQEFVQDSSSLLSLLHLWTTQPHLQFIIYGVARGAWPHIIASLAASAANENVVQTILEMCSALLAAAEGNDCVRKEILLPLLDPLCVALSTRIVLLPASTSKGKMNEVLDCILEILTSLSSHMVTLDHREGLLKALTTLLNVPAVKEEEKTKLLHLVALLYVPSVHGSIYALSCRLLTELASREGRAALGSLLLRLSEHDPKLSLFASLLIELHAPPAERTEEYDYARQMGAFDVLRKKAPSLGPEEWAPIIQAMMFFMCNESELAARTHAFSIAAIFIKRVTAMCYEDVDGNGSGSDTGCEVWYGQLLKHLYPAIKKGLACPGEAVRVEFLELLSQLVRAFSDREPFSALVPLLAGANDEENVFLNLLHLQLYRRARALRSLADFILSEPGKLVSNSTIENVLFPILNHFIRAELASHDPTLATVTQESILAMAALLSRLPAKNVISRTIKLADQIKKGTACEKTLVKLIPEIFKRFRPEAVEETLGSALLKSLTSIMMSAQNSTQIVRAPIAVAIAEFLPCLPEATMNVYVPRLFTSLANMSRHSSDDGREKARSTLTAVLRRLGLPFLPFLLRELSSALSSGHNPHILAYNLQHLLQKGIDYSASNVAPQLNLSIDPIMEIIIGDMFGERAKEKTIKEWTGKILEVKAQKSGDSLATLIQHVSPDRILSQIIVPLKHAAGRASETNWVESACHACEQGLLKRTDLEDLCPLLFTMINADSLFYQLDQQRLKQWQMHLPKFQLVASRVLNALLKRGTLPTATLDQFVAPLHSHIFSASTPLVCMAVKNFSSLLAKALPAMTDSYLNTLLPRLFDLILKSDAHRQAELVNSCFKLICALVRERDDVQLGESQLKALLEYTRSNLDSQSNSAIAYTLVKVILRRRVILVEVYELMATIARTMLRSFHPHIRQQCRSVFLSFLLDYPLARAKLEEHLSFLTANLAYEVDGGRESVVLFLGALIEKVADGELVQEMADTWWVALATRVINESSGTVLAAVKGTALKLAGAMTHRTIDRIAFLLGKWIRSANETIQKTAWTMAPILISGATAPVTAILGQLFAEIQPRTADPTTTSPEMLQTLLAIVQKSPAVKHLEFILALMKIDLRTLNAQHLSAPRNQLVGEYFDLLGLERCHFKEHTPPAEVLTEWPARWLQELQTLRKTEDTKNAEQIVKNLVFVSRMLAGRTAPDTADLAALLQKTHKLLCAKPSTRSPHLVSHPQKPLDVQGPAVLKLYAALILSLDPLEGPLVTPMVAATTRILYKRNSKGLQATDATAEGVKEMAQQVSDLLSRKLGRDVYNEMRLAAIEGVTGSEGERRAIVAKLAAADPKAYSKRRAALAQRRKETFKRPRR